MAWVLDVNRRLIPIEPCHLAGPRLALGFRRVLTGFGGGVESVPDPRVTGTGVDPSSEPSSRRCMSMSNCLIESPETATSSSWTPSTTARSPCLT
ncbi:hypothetical protein [Rossellomorea sp. NPDC077527]|uniref:hypothetical protein n=1 Tax=Rossellomorea sp. NPDC077527 TaxID=3364510 RepID=UPI0037C5A329